MTDNTYWRDLNGYVDGRLDPADASALAERAAREPEVARDIAMLWRLKASLAEHGKTLEAEAPDLPHEAAPSTAPDARRRLSVLSSVALVAGALLLWGLWSDPGQGGLGASGSGWVQAAAEAHRTLSADSLPAMPAGSFLADSVRLEGMVAPDLGAGGLSLAGAQPLRLKGLESPALHLIYRGARGCLVSLAAGPAKAMGTLPAGQSGEVWRSGDLGYLLIAPAMDPERFAALAEATRTIIARAGREDRTTTEKLARSHAESGPCRNV